MCFLVLCVCRAWAEHGSPVVLRFAGYGPALIPVLVCAVLMEDVMRWWMLGLLVVPFWATVAECDGLM